MWGNQSHSKKATMPRGNHPQVESGKWGVGEMGEMGAGKAAGKCVADHPAREWKREACVRWDREVECRKLIRSHESQRKRRKWPGKCGKCGKWEMGKRGCPGAISQAYQFAQLMRSNRNSMAMGSQEVAWPCQRLCAHPPAPTAHRLMCCICPAAGSWVGVPGSSNLHSLQETRIGQLTPGLEMEALIPGSTAKNRLFTGD